MESSAGGSAWAAWPQFRAVQRTCMKDAEQAEEGGRQAGWQVAGWPTKEQYLGLALLERATSLSKRSSIWRPSFAKSADTMDGGVLTVQKPVQVLLVMAAVLGLQAERRHVRFGTAIHISLRVELQSLHGGGESAHQVGCRRIACAGCCCPAAPSHPTHTKG